MMVPKIFKPGVRPQPAFVWAHALFTEIVFVKLRVCVPTVGCKIKLTFRNCNYGVITK